MPHPMVLFQDGGPIMIVLLLVAAAGSLVSVISAIAAAKRVRVPAAIWLLGPGLLVGLGFFRTALGASRASQILVRGSEQHMQALLSSGLSVVAYAPLVGHFFAALLLLSTAWLVAVSSLIGGDEERQWRRVGAGATLVAGLSSPLCVVALPLALYGDQAHGQIGALVGLALFAALAMAPVALAAAHDSHSLPGGTRLAGARALTGVASVGAVWIGATALGLIELIEAYQVASQASPALKAKLVVAGLAQNDVMGTARIGGTIALAIVAAASSMPVAAKLVDRRMMFNAVAWLLWVPLLANQLWFLTATAPLVEFLDDREQLMDWSQRTPDLPSGSGDAPEGMCLVRHDDSGWLAEGRYHYTPSSDCAATEEAASLPFSRFHIVVAISGASPASELFNTAWFSRSGALSVLTAPENNDINAVRIYWTNTGPSGTARLAALEPEGLFGADTGHRLGPGQHAFIVESSPRATVQDLVDACELRGCTIGPDQ